MNVARGDFIGGISDPVYVSLELHNSIEPIIEISTASYLPNVPIRPRYYKYAATTEPFVWTMKFHTAHTKGLNLRPSG